MDRVDDVGIIADVVLHAGELLRLVEQLLHAFLRPGEAQGEIVEHREVAAREAAIGVLHCLHARPHFVDVVGHVRDRHVHELRGGRLIAAEGVDQRGGGGDRRLHVLVGAHARGLEGAVGVPHDGGSAVAEKRLDAAGELLEIGIVVDGVLRHGGSCAGCGGHARERGLSGEAQRALRRRAELCGEGFAAGRARRAAYAVQHVLQIVFHALHRRDDLDVCCCKVSHLLHLPR